MGRELNMDYFFSRPQKLNILRISPVLGTFWKHQFQKVLKTGEMLNMFNLFGACSKKVLKTGEMFNMFNPPMFNPEGKYGKGIEHATFPLRIEHIEHIEHFPV